MSTEKTCVYGQHMCIGTTHVSTDKTCILTSHVYMEKTCAYTQHMCMRTTHLEYFVQCYCI